MTQNVRAGDAASWVLKELTRRMHLFLFHPEAVKTYVPWAVPPYYSNPDEQTLLNDVRTPYHRRAESPRAPSPTKLLPRGLSGRRY